MDISKVFLYAVVVFVSGLKYIIFVPFVVLQELDSLKQRGGEQNFTKKFNAKRAIRFMYELTLTTDNERLQGDYFNEWLTFN